MLKKISSAALLACSLQFRVVTQSKQEFEVASIKPSTGMGDCTSPDPGLLTCKGTLNMMILAAFEVPEIQVSDKRSVPG